MFHRTRSKKKTKKKLAKVYNYSNIILLKNVIHRHLSQYQLLTNQSIRCHAAIASISISRRFQCICQSSYFKPLCHLIQHLFTLFSPSAFFYNHSTCHVPVSLFFSHGQKKKKKRCLAFMYDMWVRHNEEKERYLALKARSWSRFWIV